MDHFIIYCTLITILIRLYYYLFENDFNQMCNNTQSINNYNLHLECGKFTSDFTNHLVRLII